MSKDQSELPYRVLGDKLKTIRQKLHETMAEVCGAVEIDEKELQSIELGQARPSEDILLLLINHFGMQDDAAANLWQLAGYDQPHYHDDQEDGPVNATRTMLMIMAVDPRIIYSDSAQVTANDSGVVINFSQGSGTPTPLITARVGMSRDQAYSLMRVLSRVMENSKPRQLPGSKSHTDNSQN